MQGTGRRDRRRRGNRTERTRACLGTQCVPSRRTLRRRREARVAPEREEEMGEFLEPRRVVAKNGWGKRASSSRLAAGDLPTNPFYANL